MTLWTGLLARGARERPDSALPCVDLGGILLRLLLFDRYVLHSTRLCEVPELVKRLGYEETLLVLRSGAIELYLDATTTGETGRLVSYRYKKGKRVLPFGSYSFQTVGVADRKEYVSGCFRQWVDPMPLSAGEKADLKGAILQVVSEAPHDLGRTTVSALRADLLAGGLPVKRAVAQVAKDMAGTELPLDQMKLRIMPIDEEDFVTETNLQQVLGVDADDVHGIIKRGLLNLAGLNQRIAEMKAFKALSGFRAGDLPLFEAKLDFVISGIDPDKQLQRARRVLNLVDLPDFGGVGTKYKLNVDRLLEVRESPECREFREWLRSVDEASDDEVVERVKSLNSRVATALKSPIGKAIRLLVGTGLGLVPGVGTLLSTVASTIDLYVVDGVLRESGIVTFVGDSYPSLFSEMPRPADYARD